MSNNLASKPASQRVSRLSSLVLHSHAASRVAELMPWHFLEVSEQLAVTPSPEAVGQRDVQSYAAAALAALVAEHGVQYADPFAAAAAGLYAATWDTGATWLTFEGGTQQALPESRHTTEIAAMEAVLAADRAAFGTSVPGSDAAAAHSYLLGVSIDFVIGFTNRRGLWDKTTAWVVENEIKPATAHSRCRYAELPELAPSVGAAATFVSHTWGAKWGTLVAAIADCADRSRRVWLDVFAVRQWPGNGADLAFDGVISRCSSFCLVCQSADIRAHLSGPQMFAKRTDLLPPAVRKGIAFLRIWCLVEIAAAKATTGLALVMKVGSMMTEEHRMSPFGPQPFSVFAANMQPLERAQAAWESSPVHVVAADCRGFSGDMEMVHNMLDMIDVAKAEASVEADRVRILSEIEASEGGTTGLNSMAKTFTDTALAGMGSPDVQAAACGDPLDLDGDLEPTQLAMLLVAAAGGGYEALVLKLLEARADPTEICSGSNALMAAAASGAHSTISLLLRHLPEHERAAATNLRNPHQGWTALHLAASRDRVDAASVLLENGADHSVREHSGIVPLDHAAHTGSTSVARLLISAGADINSASEDGETALMWACSNAHVGVVQVLLEAGADPCPRAIEGHKGGWGGLTALELLDKLSQATEEDKDKVRALFAAL